MKIETESLTLEQLRKMAGEPYWHVGLQDDLPKPHWKILPRFVAQHPEDYEYGKTWLAYPYPLPHIDREAWEPCEWCGSVGKKPDNWVCSLEDDNGHTVTNDHMVVCATANYCPSCGRPLTEEAWAELERRLRK